MEEIELPGLPDGEQSSWVWDHLSGGPGQDVLRAILGRAIVTRRWFGAKSRTLRSLTVADSIVLEREARVLLVEIDFAAGPSETFQIPLAIVAGSQAERLLSGDNASVWARIRLGGQKQVALVDGLESAAVCRGLMRRIETASSCAGASGEIVGWQAGRFAELRGDARAGSPAKVVQSEQSNSSVIYGERLILKLFRRVEMGVNPDVEISAHLTARGFAHVAPLAGGLDYRRAGREPWALAMLQQFVPNQGDAWRYTLGRLEHFLRHVSDEAAALAGSLRTSAADLCRAARRAIPPEAARALDTFLPEVERLGTRTAQMHLALAADTQSPAFAPEPFSAADARSFCTRAHSLAKETFGLLRVPAAPRSDDIRDQVARLLPLEPTVHEQLDRLAGSAVRASKIRCHGDYHLGQVLVTGDDFTIIDFEGEPARSLVERRNKQLAVRDVAGMIRSFHYASCSATSQVSHDLPPADIARVERRSRAWYFWASAAFLASYRQTAAGAVFLPNSEQEFERLLEACLLEKATYELRYELNNRPDWVYLPLGALLDLLGDQPQK